MKTAPLSVAASLLATSANAFLLPPNITPADVQIVDSVALTTPASAQTQKINLNCPGCPVTITGPRGTRIIPDKPNHLELDFSISNEEGADRLLLNGFELHPNPDILRTTLTAKQVPDWKPHFWGKHHGPHHGDGKEVEGHHGPWGGHHGPFGHGPEGSSPEGWPRFLKIEDAPLGFAMHTNPIARTDEESQLEMVEVELQIIEVGSAFVKGIPEVRIKLIKDAEGRLMIGKIEAEQKTSEDSQAEECKTALCRWAKAFFGSTGRPCHGKGKESVAAPQGGEEQTWEPREHSWGMLFKNIASHILLPVAIGIVAGVSVSLIGMVVGTVIVSLWRTFVRPARRHHHRRHHSGHSHKAARKEAVVSEEKASLMEDQEAPPAYEAEDNKKPVAEV
ncbi:hypothetical protein OQA88_7268 [Cercophora sp. LCS_1]